MMLKLLAVTILTVWGSSAPCLITEEVSPNAWQISIGQGDCSDPNTQPMDLPIAVDARFHLLNFVICTRAGHSACAARHQQKLLELIP